MGLVSIERISVSLTTAGKSVSTALTGSRASNVGNCVPFLTKRVTTAASDNFEEYTCAAYFSGTNVVVETNGGGFASRALECELEVWEFDGTDVKVQQGNFSTTSGQGSSTDTISTAVVKNNTFLYSTYNIGNISPIYDNAAFRTELTNTTTVTSYSSGTQPVASVYWFAVEATDSSFSVQHIDINFTGTSGSGTIPVSVDTTKSWLLGSFDGANATDNTNENSVDAEITSGTNIALERFWDSTDAIDYNAQVITFSDSIAANVQRGTLSRTTFIDDINIDLGTAVDTTKSLVHVSGAMGSHVSGSYDQGGSLAVPPVYHTTTFVDSDTIKLKCFDDAANASDDYDLTWEVVEWDDTAVGGATRRVMVIS